MGDNPSVPVAGVEVEGTCEGAREKRWRSGGRKWGGKVLGAELVNGMGGCTGVRAEMRRAGRMAKQGRPDGCVVCEMGCGCWTCLVN